MSQDALSLYAHIFFKVSLSLSSSALFLHFSLTLPCFPLVICFSPVGFGIPFREHIIQFLSFLEDGPRAAEWVTVGPPAPLYLTSPLFFPCHAMMSWLLFALGVHADSLGIKHSLSPTSSPLPSLTFTTLFLSQSISQILWPLKGHLEDLGMFGCCFAHPWYMFDTQKKDNYPFQLRLLLNLTDYFLSDIQLSFVPQPIC